MHRSVQANSVAAAIFQSPSSTNSSTDNPATGRPRARMAFRAGPATSLSGVAMLLPLLLLLASVGPSPVVGSDVAGSADVEAPCTRKMELQSPILYKLCLYYTHETGVEELEHEDGRWIEDAKKLLLQNSGGGGGGGGGNNNGGGGDGSIKREEQPRLHHMFIRFGRRR